MTRATPFPEAPPIVVDHVTGAVTGAGMRERLGIAAMRAVTAGLAPFGLFGLSHAVRAIGRISPPRQVQVALAPDAIFAFSWADPYWSRLLSRRAPYERELEALLRALAGDAFAFIDCGANAGYWSVQASSAAFGAHATVAIEAAPDTAVRLAQNAALNGGRFAALHRAVAAASGDRVPLFGARHEARSLTSDGGPAVAEVETLALDDLLSRPELATAPRIVLKLDVEGAERAALAGASRMLAGRDVLVVYEDHGSDPGHAVSRDLRAAGMTLFRIDGAEVRAIGDLSELATVKRRRRWGYEFLATRSPYWRERVTGLALDGRRR